MRLDSGESDLQVEGAIAKLFASETGNAAADAAIQALGGYGYIREYDVEKIKRDVKITTIYEGTSEIQQLIISTFRWRSSVQSKYEFYENLAAQMDAIAAEQPELKADVFAGLVRLVNRTIEEAHKAKATRQQYVMFHIADLATVAETGAALIKKAAAAAGTDRADYLKACARVNTALAAQTAFAAVNEILYGTGKWDAAAADDVFESSGFDYARFPIRAYPRYGRARAPGLGRSLQMNRRRRPAGDVLGRPRHVRVRGRRGCAAAQGTRAPRGRGADRQDGQRHRHPPRRGPQGHDRRAHGRDRSGRLSRRRRRLHQVRLGRRVLRPDRPRPARAHPRARRQDPRRESSAPGPFI